MQGWEEEGQDDDEEKEWGGNHAKNERNDEQKEGRQDQGERGKSVTPRQPDHTYHTEQHDEYSVPTTTIEQSRAALLISSLIISHVPIHKPQGRASPSLGYIYII